MAAITEKRRTRVLSGALDQVFSSTSNGLIIFAIAVESTAENFGRIALIMMALLTVMGAQRGAIGTPLLLKADQASARIRQEGSFALLAGLAVGIATFVVMFAFGHTLGLAGVLLAASAPIVLCQDILRYVAIADGKSHVAALWDGLWFAGTALLLIATWFRVGFITVPVLIGGWLCLATVALIGMLANLAILPHVRGFATWARAGWKHRFRYGVDSGLDQVTVFVILALVATLLTPVATAALRGATSLLAPIGILGSALQLLIISESTRNSSQPKTVWAGILRLVLAVGCLTTLFGVALCVLPVRVGTFLLGASFEPARAVLPVVTVEYAALGMTFGVGLFLKTFNRSADALGFKIAFMLIMMTTSIAAALVFRSATGVAVGLAVGTIFAGSLGIAWYAPWQSQGRARSVDIAAEYLEEETHNI